MTVRTVSMSAGLLASTVTPGITAPVVSLTTPAIPLACANAVAGKTIAHAHATDQSARHLAHKPSWLTDAGCENTPAV